jgi:hypothetical protein
VRYDGENAGLREEKLREVRNEYYRKYCSELESYIQGGEHYGESAMGLDYMINFTYNICQKYDGMVGRDSATTLLMIGHYVLLIHHTTKLIKDCFDSKNYALFATYKDIENFLAKKDHTLDSYLASRKKILAY